MIKNPVRGDTNPNNNFEEGKIEKKEGL